MLRVAKDLGLKARLAGTKLAATRQNRPLPAIAVLRDGGFLILGKVGDGGGAGPASAVAASRPDEREPSSRRSGTAASS